MNLWAKQYCRTDTPSPVPRPPSAPSSPQSTAPPLVWPARLDGARRQDALTPAPSPPSVDRLVQGIRRRLTLRSYRQHHHPLPPPRTHPRHRYFDAEALTLPTDDLGSNSFHSVCCPIVRWMWSGSMHTTQLLAMRWYANGDMSIAKQPNEAKASALFFCWWTRRIRETMHRVLSRLPRRNEWQAHSRVVGTLYTSEFDGRFGNRYGRCSLPHR